MGEASFGEHIVAGLLDPLNLVSFGGFGVPALAKGIASGAIRSTGQYMLKAAGRTALGTGALVAGLEGLSYPFDPLKTVQESAMNIAVGYAFGGAFGGLVTTNAAVTERLQVSSPNRAHALVPSIPTSRSTPFFLIFRF